MLYGIVEPEKRTPCRILTPFFMGEGKNEEINDMNKQYGSIYSIVHLNHPSLGFCFAAAILICSLENKITSSKDHDVLVQ